MKGKTDFEEWTKDIDNRSNFEYLINSFEKKLNKINDTAKTYMPFIWDRLTNIQKEAFEAGQKSMMEKWRKCFLSCSSPYCNSFFDDIRTTGILGNCEKGIKQ